MGSSPSFPMTEGFPVTLTAEQVLAKFPDGVRGKTALVTGGNSGIGKETVRVLALGGARVLLGARNEKLGVAAVAEIKAAVPGADVQFVRLDLADQAQIRECADALIAAGTPLSILVNNAGIMAPPLGHTKDGFETQWGVNHLGPFALTKRLIPLLRANAPSRVINLSSSAPWNFEPSRGVPYPPLDPVALDYKTPAAARAYSSWRAYGYSKYGAILLSHELARRYAADGITSYSLNPGNISATNLKASMTDMWGLMTARFVWLWFFAEKEKTIPQGASTTVFCATAPMTTLSNGAFYWFFGPAPASMQPCTAGDAQLARDVWDVSERQLARFF